MGVEIDSELELSTLPKTLARAAASYPSKTWLQSDDEKVSFSEADELSSQFANAFSNNGISASDIVLVMMPDTIEFILIWLALSKVGAIEVPVNSAYVGQLLTHVLNDSRAMTMVCHASFMSRLMDVEGSLTHLDSIVMVDPAGDYKLNDAVLSRFTVRRFDDFYRADAAHVAAPVNGPDMMSIVYTSGTTGPSKGVMTTQRHAFRYASTVLEALEMEHDDVVYTCGMPLFHVAAKWGAGYASLIKGATLAIPKKFSLGGFWSDVRMYGATITVLPGVVASLLYSQPRSPDDARSTLKKACMVPLIPEFEDFKTRFGMRISMAYGSTECGCPTIHPMDEAVTDRRSVGVLKSELYEMAIFDDQDNEVAPGEIGEIVLRSKEPWIMMLGYWNRPEATVEAWRNLWFHSGDAGFKDKAGRFYFVDRIKDCIRRRGENISSSEVEGIVRQHSGVLECAVYPVPSELTEDEIMVAIIPAPGADLDPADLIDSLKDMMPRFMVPRYVEILDALPKTETGKIKKQELTDRGVKITTWDHES